MKILIIDDHQLFLDGIGYVIDGFAADIELLKSNNTQDALAIVENNYDLDWIFLDLQLSNDDSFAFMAELKKRQVSTPVIILSGSEDPEVISQALSYGVSGFISKAGSGSEIVQGLKQIEKKGRYISSNIQSILSGYSQNQERTNQLKKAVGERQLQILKLAAEGKSNQKIADELDLSLSTVKGYISGLLAVLNVDNRTACIVAAREQGLIS